MTDVLFYSTNKGKIQEFSFAFSNKYRFLSLNDIAPFITQPEKEPVENSDFFILNAAIKLIAGIKAAIDINKNNNNGIKIKKVMVDDSGACVPLLNFLPGVHSAYFGGMPRSDVKNREKLKYEVTQNAHSVAYAHDEKRLPAFFICFLMSVSLDNLEKFAELQDIPLFEAQQLSERSLEEQEKLLLSQINNDHFNPTGSLVVPLDLQRFIPSLKHSLPMELYVGYCHGFVSNKEQHLLPDMGHGYDFLFYGRENPKLSFASISVEEKNRVSHRGAAIAAAQGADPS